MLIFVFRRLHLAPFGLSLVPTSWLGLCSTVLARTLGPPSFLTAPPRPLKRERLSVVALYIVLYPIIYRYTHRIHFIKVLAGRMNAVNREFVYIENSSLGAKLAKFDRQLNLNLAHLGATWAILAPT